MVWALESPPRRISMRTSMLHGNHYVPNTGSHLTRSYSMDRASGPYQQLTWLLGTRLEPLYFTLHSCPECESHFQTPNELGSSMHFQGLFTFPIGHVCLTWVFYSIDKVPKINSPVLVIHGTEDEVINFSHGMAIYKRCPRAVEPLWVEGAGHNDIEMYSQYLDRLKKFILVDLATNTSITTNNANNTTNPWVSYPPITPNSTLISFMLYIDMKSNKKNQTMVVPLFTNLFSRTNQTPRVCACVCGFRIGNFFETLAIILTELIM